MVLESLCSREKSLNELYDDLGLKKNILINTLQKLILLDYIKLSKEFYSSKLNSFELAKKINTKENLFLEINHLQKAALKQTIHDNKSFVKLRKVYLDQREKKLLSAMLFNIEAFLNGIPCKGRTKDQTLVYWCQIPMENIIAEL